MTKLKSDVWITNIANIPKVKKYCQTHEEAYIKYILDNIGYTEKPFLVDIGASDGTWLSNSKYFIEDLGFKGILLDGDNKGNDSVVHQEWIDAENICELLDKYNCPKEFDYLTLDIDGNDLYVLEEILSTYKPFVVLAEFNGTIANGENKTIKYNPSHQWNNDDYYGFSFDAGVKMFDSMGYKVIFQNDSLNMYAVRKDLLANDVEINVSYVPNQYHPHNETGVWVTV